jgi:hypothetical protein
MRINKITLTFALIAILFNGTTQQAQGATIKEGAKCVKLNASVKAGNLVFKCLKSGKKLVLVPKFSKCADVITASRAPILKEVDPLLYLANAGLDRDKDGIACDK